MKADLSSGLCTALPVGYWDTVTRKGHTSRIGYVRISGKRIPRMKQIAYARLVCSSCPVQAACLEAGRNEPEGIWGGTLPDER